MTMTAKARAPTTTRRERSERSFSARAAAPS